MIDVLYMSITTQTPFYDMLKCKEEDFIQGGHIYI